MGSDKTLPSLRFIYSEVCEHESVQRSSTREPGLTDIFKPGWYNKLQIKTGTFKVSSRTFSMKPNLTGSTHDRTLVWTFRSGEALPIQTEPAVIKTILLLLHVVSELRFQYPAEFWLGSER